MEGGGSRKDGERTTEDEISKQVDSISDGRLKPDAKMIKESKKTDEETERRKGNRGIRKICNNRVSRLFIRGHYCLTS